jgi:hypothetical protein
VTLRIRVVAEPPVSDVDGIRLDCFRIGQEYEVGNTIAALFLAEGWAVPVTLGSPRPPSPFDTDDPYDPSRLYVDLPQNLKREIDPPSLERGLAADVQRFKRRKAR